MTRYHLTLSLLAETYAICRLEPTAEIPVWALSGELGSVTRTPDELSIVCVQEVVPEAVPCEGGWRALKVEGPLDFSLSGVLASLIEPLAAGIPVFVISTFDTDYLMVRGRDLEGAVQALTFAGHHLQV